MNPAYLEDASGLRGTADAVYIPASETELSEVLQQASGQGIPVTIAGAGTGVAGGRVPSGGWVISLEKFRRLDVEKGRARVGAGILLRELQGEAQRTGQFYAPDPTETAASIGGTIATNASGSRSFRFGDTRRHILALRVVFADGAVREMRRGEPVDFAFEEVLPPQTTKHSAGFFLRRGMDLLDLFIGSEGTLAVITEAEVQLLPVPRELLSGVIFFPEDDLALSAVEAWRAIGGLRMIEYFDAASLELLRRRYDDIPAAARAALLIEQEVVSGNETDEWLDRLESEKALGEESWFGSTAADRERFRRFRHALPEVVNDTVRRRGLMKMGTDFAVPLSRSREMMAYYRHRLDAEFPGKYVIFGHIGDAHVHANILPESGAESDRARELITEMASKAVQLGGTVAAEHGLGKRKAHLLAIQYGPAEIISMLSVKHRFDPKNILGAGTLFPASKLV